MGKSSTKSWLNWFVVGLVLVSFLTGYWSSDISDALSGLVIPFTSGRGEQEGEIEFQRSHLFEDFVQPVFAAKCTSCHGPTRQEGGLQLDSLEGVKRGGWLGAVMMPGNPDSSELLRRTTLPPEDKSHMPPEGHTPLDLRETELLRWWVQEGARERLRVAEIEDVPASVTTILNRTFGPRGPARSGIFYIDISPPSVDAVRKLKTAGFGIRLLSKEYSFLQIDAFNLGEGFGDQTLELLRPVSQQVASLNLARTSLGDRGMVTIGALKNLVHLNLSRTEVSDVGLAELRGLSYLESLNLVGTTISNKGLRHLSGLTTLRNLYLWQSQSSEAGWRDLGRKLPKLKLNTGLSLEASRAQEFATK